MSSRNTAIALVIAVVAVVLQTTLFVDVRPFGAVPRLPLLVVLAGSRHLDPDPAVLFGFTTGLLTDLLGSSPLGMWALVMTAAAYVTLRVRERTEEAPAFNLLLVFVVTLLGEVLFLLLGTLFGLKLLSQAGLIGKLLLTAFYNMLLAAAAFPIISRVMTPRRRTWAVL